MHFHITQMSSKCSTMSFLEESSAATHGRYHPKCRVLLYTVLYSVGDTVSGTGQCNLASNTVISRKHSILEVANNLRQPVVAPLQVWEVTIL